MDATYLDFNASAPLPPELLGELGSLAQSALGNPSSLHSAGRQSRRLINEAATIVCRYLNCHENELYWTSGASEANAWALCAAVAKAAQKGHKARLLVSALEHESTLAAARRLSEGGLADLDVIRARPDGQIDLAHLESLLEQPADLVSVLHANNETGVIQPLTRIAQLTRAKGVALHADCVQALGKVSLSLRELGATYTTFSGHKIGAPKGVGFLVSREPLTAREALIAGKQQRGARGGTENAMGVAVLGRIVSALAKDAVAHNEQLRDWHRRFEQELERRIPGVVIHAALSPRLPNTTFVGFKGVDSDSILASLDLEGICASAGSACSSGTLEPSPALLAMGCDPAMARSSVRFSSGRGTKWEDFERVLNVLPAIVARVTQKK